MIRLAVMACLAGALLFVAGCGRSSSPEQAAADSTLAAARAALEQGDYEGAQQGFRALLKMEGDLGRVGPQAEAARALAMIAVARAEFDSAFALYGKSRELYRGLADRESARRVTIDVASLHRLMGEELQAFTLLEEALRLARVFGDSGGVHEVELAILPSCRLLDRRDVETQAVNDLLKAYSGEKDAGTLARVYEEVGSTQLFRREYARAAEHFLRGTALADQAGDSVRGTEMLLDAGIALAGDGRTQEAFQSYGKALRRTDRLHGTAAIRSELLLRVGNAYARSKQFEQARRFYTPALSAAVRGGNKLAEGYLVLQMALCDLDRNPGESVRNIGNAVELFQGTGSSRASTYALLCLGTAHERANRLTDAIQAYRAAVDELEATRAYTGDDLYADCEGTFFPQYAGAPYDHLLDALFRTGQYDLGFQYAQRRQSWELRKIFDRQELRHQGDPAEGPLAGLQHAVAVRTGAEKQLARLLEAAAADRVLSASIHTVLDKSSVAIADRTAEIVRANKTYEPFVRLAPLAISEIQKRLLPGDALLWYVPGKRSLSTVVLSASRVSVEVAAMERERLLGLVGELASALQRAEAKGDSISKVTALPDLRTQEVLRQLYEAFVRPVEGALSSASRLAVVLPRELATVPVHALRRNNVTPFLSELKTVSYLPGAHWLVGKGTEPAAVRTVAGLGFAGTTAWDVEYELRDIRAFFKEARLAFGEHATLEELQKERADVLHLALGVRFAARAPWNAALILSDGKTSTTSEPVPLGALLTLPPVQTVVFSCLSPDQPMTPALVAPLFLSNGSRYVIATAYTPSRKLKKFFCESWYTDLASGASPEQAFRKAQRDMIHNPEFSSPLVWSAYTLWGK